VKVRLSERTYRTLYVGNDGISQNFENLLKAKEVEETDSTEDLQRIYDGTLGGFLKRDAPEEEEEEEERRQQ